VLWRSIHFKVRGSQTETTACEQAVTYIILDRVNDNTLELTSKPTSRTKTVRLQCRRQELHVL